MKYIGELCARRLDAEYRDHGLVVIGVHAPEFAFEKDLGNVRKAVASLGVRYPAAVDNGYSQRRIDLGATGVRYGPDDAFIGRIENRRCFRRSSRTPDGSVRLPG